MREQGKLRWIGVSNFSVDQMKRALKIAPITSLQPPYSMLRRAIEAEILPFAQANGIGVINYSPMLSGLLTGKMTAERIAALPADDWRRKNVEFSEPRLSRNMRLVELLREIGNGHGVTPGVVAVAWTLHNPAITAAIVGGRSGKQVEETAAALDFRLSQRRVRTDRRFLKDESRRRPRKKARSAKARTPAEAGVLCLRGGEPDYIAATKSGTMTAAFSCSNCVMRAAMPVYIEAARKAFTRTPSLAWRERVLRQSRQHAYANLHGVAVQCFDEQAIDAFAMFRCEVRHLQHDAAHSGTSPTDPSDLPCAAMHLRGSRSSPLSIGSDRSAHVLSTQGEASQQRIPGLRVATPHVLRQ